MGDQLQPTVSRDEAMRVGSVKYFTGLVCKHGHVAERYAKEGRCAECIRIKNSNPERMAKNRVYALHRWRSSDEVKERGRIADRKRSTTEKRKAYCRQLSKTEKAVAYRKRRHKKKMASDAQYALRHNVRNRIKRAIKGNYKSGSALDLLGCTIENLKRHLERQFRHGMNWKNMGKGTGKWNIDHVLPLAGFDLTNERQLAEACNFKNLQPLWHEENAAKKALHPIAFAQMSGFLL